MDFRILTELNYDGKAWHQAAADSMLFPVRKLLGGKRVECVQLNSKAVDDDAMKFRAPNHRIARSLFRKIVEKTALVALSILMSPLILVGLIAKAIGDDRGRALHARYLAAEGDLKNNYDKLEERDILDDSIYFQLVEKITAQLQYGKFHQSSHLHADKYMESDSRIDQCNQVTQRPGRILRDHQGGLFFISAKNIKGYIDELLESYPHDTDVLKAKKVMDEYHKWSLRMVPLMLPRFVSVYPGRYIEKMAFDLQKRIESLQEQESFLVPVNLRMETGGFHTITLEFGREREKYYFKIHNVGAGVDHHDITHDEGKIAVSPFSVENISLDELTELSFLKGFVDQATFSDYSAYSCSEFYEFVGNYFGEEKGHLINHHGDGVTKRLQHSGTCIFKSPTTALKSVLGTDAYKKIMLMIKLNDWQKLYKDYVENKDGELSDDYEKGNVLAHIAFHNLERNIQKQAARVGTEPVVILGNHFADFMVMGELHDKSFA